MPEPVFIPQVGDTTLLAHSAFGEQFARMTYNWMIQLKWPEPETGPLQYRPGMTWIELGLSWMCWHECYVPVLRKNQAGDLHILPIRPTAEAIDHGVSFTECGTIIEKMIGNTMALVPQLIFPTVKSQKSAALYHLGAPKYYQGMNVRPQLPAQDKVFEILRKTLVGSDTGRGMTSTPKLLVRGDIDDLVQSNWAAGSKKALNAMHKARAARKRLGI